MSQDVFWTPERQTEAVTLAGLYGNRAAAQQMSERHGVDLTPEAIRNTVRRHRLTQPQGLKSGLAIELEQATDKFVPSVAGLAQQLLDDEIDSLAKTQECEPLFGGRPPAIHTSRTAEDRWLVIPDLQIPFEAHGALQFCIEIQREYRIPQSNILCVGDEVDFYNFSRYSRSPDADLTPKQELEANRKTIRRWAAAFPEMRLCTSNHGTRVAKRATEAGLPSELFRSYSEILGAPAGWRWARFWRIKGGKQEFLVEHGDRAGQGIAGLRDRPLKNGISTVWGHMHAQPGIVPVRTIGQRVWGMCVGSLIDANAYAFEYGLGATFNPWLGAGVILDGGAQPVLVPYENGPARTAANGLEEAA